APCAAATSGWNSAATSRSIVAPAPVTCLIIMAGPSCCERYDESLLDQPRVMLLRAAFFVTPDSHAPSFLSSASVSHRGDRPLRGVGRGLSTSAGDAVLSRRHQDATYTVRKRDASLHGGQCRIRCRYLRRKAPMCGDHRIDNRPTIDTTPSGIPMVT